jgi:hypothetical protein
MKRQTAAEGERQSKRNRDSSGRYKEMLKCDGGCGRSVNVQGDYFSHPLTDCDDREGQNFSDIAIALCKQCGKVAQRPELQTVREWTAFVEQQQARAK